MYTQCYQDRDCVPLADKDDKKKVGFCLGVGRIGMVCVQDPLESCITANDCSILSDCLHTLSFEFAICVPLRVVEARNTSVVNWKLRLSNTKQQTGNQEHSGLSNEQGDK